jgi:hypothetical protein
MRHVLLLCGVVGSVVFGWMTIASVISQFGDSVSLFGAFNVPLWVMPWVSLIITQLIIPNASAVVSAAPRGQSRGSPMRLVCVMCANRTRAVCVCVTRAQGHLSGIIVGYLLAFGVFDWVDTYLWLCALSWYRRASGHGRETTDVARL